MKKANNLTHVVIEERAWGGGQGVKFSMIAQLGEHKIKISIDRDTYDNQSHARGFVFSTAAMDWKSIYSIPYPQMASLKLDAYGKTPVPADFRTDVNTILAGIKSIIF